MLTSWGKNPTCQGTTAMRWLRRTLRWRLQSFLVILPIIAIPLWLYAERSRQLDQIRGDVIHRSREYAAFCAQMEKSHRDHAAGLGEQAAACLEQAQKARTSEEKATWSEKAVCHKDEARKALVIAETYARSRQDLQSGLRAADR
jgi:hypothetical protein